MRNRCLKHPDDLIEGNSIKGILAGPRYMLNELSDIFSRKSVAADFSIDPIGVQTADIMARVYAVWINFLTASKRVVRPPEIGLLMTQASQEACSLALALGANPKTFQAGSIPWSATFIAACMGGPWQEFGKKAGLAVKKGKESKAVIRKLSDKWTIDGKNLQALTDMQEAFSHAERLKLQLPILKEATRAFFGGDDNSG